MSVAEQLNRVQYISEDFDTYRTEADDFWKTYYPADFNNVINTDLGNALLDQHAFAMQALAFMVNRRASELYLPTARINKSVVKIARMLGKSIESAHPASCNVTLNFPDGPYSYPVQIQNGFQFQGPGDIIYEYRNAAPAILPVGSTQLQITAYEGETRRSTFISNGDENQQFNVYGVPSANYLYSDDMELKVDGVLWTRYDLLKYESTNIYEVLFTDAPPKLRFGDGIMGNIPPENAEIVAKFVYGKGQSGSIASNQLSGVVNPLIVNGLEINIEVTNDASIIGSDPEDIRHVKSFASVFFRTQSAAVVKEDYDSIAKLQTGIVLADAQIMRGVSGDITIQEKFLFLEQGQMYISDAVSGIMAADVSGVGYAGVSGADGLAVSGQTGLGVGGIPGLGVSGVEYLGIDVSGNITGLGYLGVQGVPGLYVTGQSGLIVVGQNALGVSGLQLIGIEGRDEIEGKAQIGYVLISSGVSGLESYLSQSFSDTSKANNVQVILLSVDGNNRYVSPTSQTITDVQTKLQTMADAVVTVKAVDGVSRVIDANIYVELGISQTAVQADVEAQALKALTGTTSPYGLLVRRDPGLSLYKSDVEDAIRAGTVAADVRYVNVRITGPAQYLDANGNLIISKQYIVQNGSVQCKVVQRFLNDGSVTNV